ncbi:ABC transporter permease [Nisaea acidiphila]|uniref:Transport permease protein n=1 Tax=Nisaea acidiphila TaxID=1862145 RepID=A0A9J7B0C3_9PROT|nr:ABC transporter permease [Nisaea acidiphila]UUX51932.1 ABC transporter permease [Nisaea acidiphila]
MTDRPFVPNANEDFAPVPTVRRVGPVNWIGVWTLYEKEVRRFLKVITQTVFAPVVTSLLFLAIFTLALQRSIDLGNGISYSEFLAPGLVVMAMMQNAFANTSSSIMISKVQGNIVDVLMPPLGPGELLAAFALGGVTRGLIVGTSTVITMAFAVGFHAAHWPVAIFFALSASLAMSLIGIAAGMWSGKFDHLSSVTNFVIQPLAFLSGTFYSIDRLPGIWNQLAHLNPFFYMIDGVRYGLIGWSDTSPLIGAAVLTAMNAALIGLCYLLLKRGYKIKS